MATKSRENGYRDGMDLYDFVASLPGGETFLGGLTTDHSWRKVRTFKPTSEDGREAIVWASRYPAQFFRLTTGDVEITTGSGTEMGHLMLALGNAIADGMVGFRNGREG